MIECKYKNTIKKDDYKGLINLSHKFSTMNSILITKYNHTSPYDTIITIPAYLVEKVLR